jgi:acetyl-CoA carboxylase biotin carboxyl carrier protein
MNIKKIKELIELMNENGLAEVEVETEGSKIRLSKNAKGVVEQVIASAPGRQAQAGEASPSEVAPKQASGQEVKSPMVGTFYSASSPDVEAFVKVGSIIQKGDVLCIVEAMKLMNEVKAEFGGKVVEILVENAEAVEYGQPLFLVEPV